MNVKNVIEISLTQNRNIPFNHLTIGIFYVQHSRCSIMLKKGKSAYVEYLISTFYPSPKHPIFMDITLNVDVIFLDFLIINNDLKYILAQIGELINYVATDLTLLLKRLILHDGIQVDRNTQPINNIYFSLSTPKMISKNLSLFIEGLINDAPDFRIPDSTNFSLNTKQDESGKYFIEIICPPSTREGSFIIDYIINFLIHRNGLIELKYQRNKKPKVEYQPGVKESIISIKSFDSKAELKYVITAIKKHISKALNKIYDHDVKRSFYLSLLNQDNREGNFMLKNHIITREKVLYKKKNQKEIKSLNHLSESISKNMRNDRSLRFLIHENNIKDTLTF